MQHLVSAPEMRELDRQTIEELEIPGRTLMEIAGRAVADVVAERVEPGGRVVVACGLGNNGGDGFVAARVLADRGYAVKVFIVGDRAAIRGDAANALAPVAKLRPESLFALRDAKDVVALCAAVGEADLAVDALLGTGLSKPVAGLYADAVSVLNDSATPVVAVDIPSGVDADTGAVLGQAVWADVTVTFAFAKRGQLLHPGAEHCGELVVVDIGIPDLLADRLPVVGRLLLPEDGPALLPTRRPSAHKGDFGHLVVLAGSPATPGAAILALQGALRAGAGLCSWAADEATVAAAPPRPPEVMLRARRAGESVAAWAERLLDGATALCVGPGLSTSAERAEELGAVLAQCAVPICADADALNLLAARPELWSRVKAPLVLTPHPKEMARLMGSDVAAVQRDRFAAALQLAAARRAVVVLKGAATCVGDHDGQVAVIGAGNPGMATGGTGDLLAGIIGGLLAQRLDPVVAARAGALVHAVAGDEAAKQHGRASLRVTDLCEAIGAVLAAWDR